MTAPDRGRLKEREKRGAQQRYGRSSTLAYKDRKTAALRNISTAMITSITLDWRPGWVKRAVDLQFRDRCKPTTATFRYSWKYGCQER